MKILCPSCSTAANIDGITRYACIQCSCCGRKYKGFEAKVSRGNFFLNIFNPFVDSYFEFGQWETTHCYHCNEDLTMCVFEDGTYSPPKRCPSCSCRLDCKKATPDSKVDYVLPPVAYNPFASEPVAEEPPPPPPPPPMAKPVLPPPPPVEKPKDKVALTIENLKENPQKVWGVVISCQRLTPEQLKAVAKAVPLPKATLLSLYDLNMITINGMSLKEPQDGDPPKADFTVDDPFSVFAPVAESELSLMFSTSNL